MSEFERVPGRQQPQPRRFAVSVFLGNPEFLTPESLLLCRITNASGHAGVGVEPIVLVPREEVEGRGNPPNGKLVVHVTVYSLDISAELVLVLTPVLIAR